MKIEVTIDEYIEAKLLAHKHTAETVSECIELLNELNGDSKTQAIFSYDDMSLLIGGGSENRYTVSMWDSSKEEGHLLRNHTNDSGKEQHIVSGGQRGIWNSASVINQAMTIQALTYFAETGKRDSGLIWIQDI